MDIETPLKTIIVDALDAREVWVLAYIAKEEQVPWYECSGDSLDGLVAKGLAETINTERDKILWQVRCTPLGREVADLVKVRPFKTIRR